MCLASVLSLYDEFVIARLRNRNKQVHVQVDVPVNITRNHQQALHNQPSSSPPPPEK